MKKLFELISEGENRLQSLREANEDCRLFRETVTTTLGVKTHVSVRYVTSTCVA